MENDQTLETFAAHFGKDASVRNVYGEPIATQGKTIIPVAKIAMGYGHGHGKKNGKNNAGNDNGKNEEGAGGGGGMFATAKGVYEVTAKGTRFVPANALRNLFVAAMAGFIVGRLFRKKKK